MYLFWFNEFIFGNSSLYTCFIYSFLLLMLVNKKKDILKNHIFNYYIFEIENFNY